MSLLFRGGPIYPMLGPGALEGVLLTRGRHIVYVGPEAGLPRLPPDVEPIELAGRPLLPGLCDSHLHLVLAAAAHADLDCRRMGSAELQAALRQETAVRRAGQWITGYGWERRLLFPGGPPDWSALRAVARENPVLLMSKDTHSAWLNPAGLRRLQTLPRLPAHCSLQLDAAKQPTGLVLEDVLPLRSQLVPQLTADEKRGRLAPFVRQLLACGITAVHSNEPPEELELWRTYLAEDAGPRVRTLWNLVFDSPEQLRARRGVFHTRLPGWLTVGGAKLFLDGTLGSHTAALSMPYVGTADRGLLTLQTDELARWLAALQEVGVAGAFHVIGDRAADEVMAALVSFSWPAGTLHRLEHLQIAPRRTLAPGGLAGLVCSMQPSHMWDDRELVERHLDPALAPLAYPLRSLLDNDGLLVFGSDAPVESIDPWRGICAAVTRLADGDTRPWNPDEALTLHQALQAHTSAPAALHGQAFAVGTLEPGRLADLVVLSADPFAREPASLRHGLSAALTFVDGRLVHQA